jgi:phage gp29-like protein
MPRKTTPKVLQDEVAIRTYVDAVTDVTRLLPHPSKVLSNICKRIDVFETTLKQPDIAGVSRRFREGVKKLEWDVARTTNRGDLANWVKQVVGAMPLDQIIPAAVSARDFGYTVFEAMWAMVGSQLLIVNLVEKPREWFQYDQGNNLLLITREHPNGIRVDENFPKKFIVVQHEASYKNPYGNGLLDEAYWYAKGLAANFEYHLSFLEDDGRDHWMGWVPASSDAKYIDDVEDALRRLRNAAVAVVYEGTKIEKVENKGRTSTSAAYEIFKKSCRTTINMLWLGSDLAAANTGTGAYASSKSGMEIQDDAISAGKELAENLINTAVQWMFEINGINPGQEEVKFELSDPPDNDKTQADIDKTYADATGRKPSDQLLAKRGYEPGDWEERQQQPTALIGQAPAPDPAQTFESGYDINALLDDADRLKKKY